MYPFGLACLQKLKRKFGLAEAFAAGDRDAAAGSLEERHVASDPLHNLVNRIVGAAHIQRLGGAGFGAFAALVAFGPVDGNEGDFLVARQGFFLFPADDGAIRADIQAVAAFFDADALDFHPVELRLERLGLGAVAPGAAQGAALQEERQADAGAVVDGKALDIVKFSG